MTDFTKSLLEKAKNNQPITRQELRQVGQELSNAKDVRRTHQLHFASTKRGKDVFDEAYDNEQELEAAHTTLLDHLKDDNPFPPELRPWYLPATPWTPEP